MTSHRPILSFDQLIGRSPAWRPVMDVARRAAPSRATVLILGETGTGKEMLAKAVHAASDRADQPFVRVNCGALSGALLESELFGHVRGAFTGAIEDKQGRFEVANFGTLFLDEIGTLELPLQVKLLRVLQEREFERVGSSHTISVDTRIIAATNLHLLAEVQQKRFREDLFYRLNVVTLKLPALRDRMEDLPALIAHFLAKYNQENRRSLPMPDDAAMEMLLRHHWPGNVRELENVCERAVVLGPVGGPFGVSLLPDYVLESSGRAAGAGAGGWQEEIDRAVAAALADQGLNPGELYNAVVSRMETSLIRGALQKCGGVKIRAADFLGLNRNTLHKKCQDYQIDTDAGSNGSAAAGAAVPPEVPTSAGQPASQPAAEA